MIVLKRNFVYMWIIVTNMDNDLYRMNEKMYLLQFHSSYLGYLLNAIFKNVE
jgi:hypothetical protein